MTKMVLKYSLIFLAIILISISSFGQETDEDTGKLPVKSTFTAGVLIETPTIMSPPAQSLVLNIQHRFSNMENGISDIFGIYGAANTRLALSYGITDNIMLGFASEKTNKLQEIFWKIAILKQTRSGNIPVSISYYGNIVADANEKSKFYPGENSYKFIHRLSYLTEILIARKFNDIFSLQVAPQLAYFNAVNAVSATDTVNTIAKNFNYGISVGGRAKLWESKTIIVEYDQPLTSGGNAKPNLSLGLEIGTATHAFQVFVTNYNGIVGQQNLAYNTNDPFNKEISKNFMFGFNITVRL
jgi:hypothetical protein